MWHRSITRQKKMTAWATPMNMMQGAVPLPSTTQKGGLEKSYTYDPYGNVVKEMDGLGHVVLYSYDALGA